MQAAVEAAVLNEQEQSRCVRDGGVSRSNLSRDVGHLDPGFFFVSVPSANAEMAFPFRLLQLPSIRLRTDWFTASLIGRP